MSGKVRRGTYFCMPSQVFIIGQWLENIVQCSNNPFRLVKLRRDQKDFSKSWEWLFTVRRMISKYDPAKAISDFLLLKHYLRIWKKKNTCIFSPTVANVFRVDPRYTDMVVFFYLRTHYHLDLTDKHGIFQTRWKSKFWEKRVVLLQQFLVKLCVIIPAS